jgi:hypothetical protein
MTMTLTKLIKHQKVTPNKRHQAGKKKGLARRKRAPTDSAEDTTITLAPYKWTQDGKEKRTTKGGEAIMSTRAAAKNMDTEMSETDSEEDEKEDEDDDDPVVCSGDDNSNPTHTPAAASPYMPQIQALDENKILKLNNEKLESRIKILSRQIKSVSKIGAVDKYEVMMVRKTVKEDLFKKVKFITSSETEKKCMRYLCKKRNIPTDEQRDWSASYAHCLRDALNNKRNNVSQDLKIVIKGKKA